MKRKPFRVFYYCQDHIFKTRFKLSITGFTVSFFLKQNNYALMSVLPTNQELQSLVEIILYDGFIWWLEIIWPLRRSGKLGFVQIPSCDSWKPHYFNDPVSSQCHPVTSDCQLLSGGLQNSAGMSWFILYPGNSWLILYPGNRQAGSFVHFILSFRC